MAYMPSRSLKPYRDKRLADATPEPFGGTLTPATGKLFVVQQHRATHLHWDLRLEMDGVLRSWAVPKGPSADPADKRFAALVEDHPLDYGSFEGTIPAGNYGAGEVIVWDRGTWKPLNDTREGLKKGKLLFELFGFKLHGRWTLVRMKKGRDGPGNEWLFIKERDQCANPELVYSDRSVYSGLTVEELKNPAGKARRLVSAARRLEGAQVTDRTVGSAPMLATPGKPFDGKDWLFELKYDGYRIMIDKDEHGLTLRSRNGHDLTRRFPEIARSAGRIPPDTFVMDGELVVLNERGVPDFSLLQQRARAVSELEVARLAIELPCTYFAFDLLALGDRDIREAPLEKRKKLLQKLVPELGAIRFSEHVADIGKATFHSAGELGLEGVVAKRRDSPYRSGRSNDWIKIRHQRTGDFVILGWVPSRSNARDIGALALGEYRHGELIYVGRAGSGLGAATRRELALEFEPLAGAEAPAGVQPDRASRVQWLEPRLACEVSYREYTRDGHLRHPVFQRLRPDKPVEECHGDGDGHDDPGAIALAAAEAPEVVVTHPDKIFYPEQSLSKLDLVRYYEKIAPWMLPYLKDRPIVLTRFPDGIHGKSFYQRDAPDFVPDWIRREILWSESAEREIHYFIVESAAALQYLANLGTIPIHTAHSTVTDLEHPDWCVLDLDPKSAPFKDVILLANAIGELADELSLPAYPKTSGKSGLHVLVPLARQLTHDHARTLAELMARVVVRRYPDQATVARSVKAREGRVYVDYLQNGQGRLLVAPFSARAEPAASVSMPLKWSEVNGRLSNHNYHLRNALRRMKRLGNDPLAPVLTDQPDLERALQALAAITG
jgi:bifunctional non-homologous end joining protein LigD